MHRLARDSLANASIYAESIAYKHAAKSQKALSVCRTSSTLFRSRSTFGTADMPVQIIHAAASTLHCCTVTRAKTRSHAAFMHRDVSIGQSKKSVATVILSDFQRFLPPVLHVLQLLYVLRCATMFSGVHLLLLIEILGNAGTTPSTSLACAGSPAGFGSQNPIWISVKLHLWKHPSFLCCSKPLATETNGFPLLKNARNWQLASACVHHGRAGPQLQSSIRLK